MVLNAVSFKDGKKFQNHIRDHIRLREVSDSLCRERGLSVLEDAPFYKTESRGEHWARRRGGMTHRDILKQDIEDSLRYAMNFDGLISHLRAKGFLYDWERGSIRAPDWERARFDRLHEEYMVMSSNGIHTENDLAQFISEKESQIGALERERQSYRNQLRRPKPPEIETELKEKITATTNQLKPLRRDLAAARRVSEHWRHLYELLQSEHEMEIKALKRERSRGR